LASKPVATVSTGLTSKPAATIFSSLALKLVATISSGLALKPVVGFLVGPQNQVGGGFSFWDLKTKWLRFVGCTTKSTEEGRCGTRVEI
jgi:hypothetical protein